MNPDFHMGLLHLIHLLIRADGVVDDREQTVVNRLKEIENISDAALNEFNRTAAAKKEREIYNEGIRLLNTCTDEQKIRGIIYLYKISEADNHVHVKEVRLLLYSVKLTSVEFSDVVKMAKEVKF